MSRYTTITYARRTPQVKVQRILASVSAAPQPPPPVLVYYLISGTVTQDGSAPGFSTGIEFTSLGTIFTATSGSYGLFVQLGYGGTAIPHSTFGEFTPQVRTYGSVVADTPNQDYAFVPYPDLLITGAVRLDGLLLSGAAVNLSGSGVYLSDGAGTYVGTVDYGYTGAGALGGYGLPNYAVSPASRVYTNLITGQAGQDYNITTQILLVQGTITAAGTGQAISLTNGTSIWSSASSGSYGYNVIGGWSGSTVPSYISVPGSYVYGSLTSSQLAQNFDLPVPFLTYTFPNLDWSTWSYTLPDHWQIQAQNPVSLVWSDTGTVAGTATSSEVIDFGTSYRIYGHSASHAQITPFSNSVAAAVVVITGEIRLDGVPLVGASVSFTGDGQATSGASGTYFGTLPSGYSGTATALGYSAPAYQVIPTARVYANLTTNQAGQDFDVETLVWTIEGTTSSNGTGIATEITNGIATWNTAAGGSYSYLVVGGWSGSTVPTYISDPGSYSYISVQADFLNQDFEIPAPELFYAPTTLSWGGWAYASPALWRIEVSVTGSTAWTFYDYTAGTNVNYPVASAIGSYFRIHGATSGSNQITPLSNVVYAEPPDPGSFLISGALTDEGSPMVGIGVEVTAYGTVVTNGAGTYSQTVTSGYTGTVIPHYTGGTFDPQYRLYSNVTSDQLNQDYTFHGTVIIDCPIPSQLQVVLINTEPKNPSRNVIDPVNNLLWVIDETYSNVYYIDVVAGTHLGTVDLGLGQGCPAIAYDDVNAKIVVTNYSGSTAFIDPVTKAFTLSNFTQLNPVKHSLVAKAGTIYASELSLTGSLYVVDGASEQLLATYPYAHQQIYAYSLAWADNINRLVVNNVLSFGPFFYLFDPATGSFSPSDMTLGAFNPGEGYYVKGTGDLLRVVDVQPVQVINIGAGTAATVVAELSGNVLDGQPLQVLDLTENTCTETVLVSDGGYGVWEYSMDGNYTLINVFSNQQQGLDQIGLAHSRATNLVYYESAGTVYTLPYTNYVISGTVTENGNGLDNFALEIVGWGTVYTNVAGEYSYTVPAHWNGTVLPHPVNGSVLPPYSVYSNVTSDINQDYAYFWSGYIFLTSGVDGTWASLPTGAVVVDGTIVQVNGNSNVYTSTEGRTGWTFRGITPITGLIAYGGVYVLAGDGGQVWTTDDFDSWTSRTSNVTGAVTALTYNGGRFVAGCLSGETTTSTDGTNWTASSAGTLPIFDVFYTGSLFVAVGLLSDGQTTCYTSPNGVDWTFQTVPAHTWYAGVHSPELGLSVIVGQDGALAVSSDAVTWTEYAGVFDTTLLGIAWGNGRFVVGSGFGAVSGAIWTSANGTEWDYVMSDPYLNICKRMLYWKNDWFVFVEDYSPA